MKTHLQYTIQLECKLCKYKNTRTLVLPFKKIVRIGCSGCKQSWIRFIVLEFASWSSTDSELDVKVTK